MCYQGTVSHRGTFFQGRYDKKIDFWLTFKTGVYIKKLDDKR